MRRSTIVTAIAALIVSLSWTDGTRSVNGHCQVPCGIYDDAARVKSMEEDAVTIAKAMDQLQDLAGHMDQAPSVQHVNQIVRWVSTKESHASNIIETVSLYFLTQKVKPVAAGAEGYDDYLKKLAAHHAVMRAAMVAKQTTDPANARKLSDAIHALSHYYVEHKH